jgi:hypothetical protein
MKIPTTWLDSEYRKNISVSAYQIMLHALAYLSGFYEDGAVPKSAILNVHEFLVACYPRKKFGGSYYKTIRKGLEELCEKKIVKDYYFDKGVLTITFYTLFVIEIYGKENLFTFDRLDELYEKALKEKG